MKFIYLSFIVLASSVCLAGELPGVTVTQSESSNLPTRLDSEPTFLAIYEQQLKLASLDMQGFKTDATDRLNENEKQIALILTRLQHRDSDMGNYIDALSWTTGIVLGFVGIIFGIGAFILYRENRDVSNRINAHLAELNKQTANQQNKFDQWFYIAKKDYARELDLLGRIMRLRIMLDQDNPLAEDVYPEISPLFSKPKLEYLPIFQKVMTLDMGADIERHTQAAIDQITEQRT